MRRLAFVEGLDGFYVTMLDTLHKRRMRESIGCRILGHWDLVGIVMRCTYLSS